MKSSLSQLLNREHDFILKAGKIICLQRSRWLTDPAEYERNIKQLLDFFSIYADKFHHHKEEEILFPAIGKKSEIAGAGMVPELIEHHIQFRTDIQQIRATLTSKDFSATQEYLENYINQLKDHIAAENDELFPMAEDILSPDELDKLYYKCIDKDRELGEFYKEELENFINNFERNEAIQ